MKQSNFFNKDLTNLLSKFDPIIHDKIRLGILTILVKIEGEVTFSKLKNDLQVTDGNLSTHMKVLAENRIVKIRKTFVGKKPRTSYRITSIGRKKFFNYLNNLGLFLRNLDMGGKNETK